MTIRLFALALVLLAGPAAADVDCGLEGDGQIHCYQKPSPESGYDVPMHVITQTPQGPNDFTVPYTYLPVQGAENKLVEGSLPEGCTRGFDGSIVCNPVPAHVDNNPSAWGTTPSGTPYNGTFIYGHDGVISTNSNLLSVQPPPTPHCEDGWVMVSVAARGTWWVNDEGMTTVKKCAPAGDLKDPK